VQESLCGNLPLRSMACQDIAIQPDGAIDVTLHYLLVNSGFQIPFRVACPLGHAAHGQHAGQNQSPTEIVHEKSSRLAESQLNVET
jgi:hypothetical protein